MPTTRPAPFRFKLNKLINQFDIIDYPVAGVYGTLFGQIVRRNGRRRLLIEGRDERGNVADYLTS